ncbi:NAD(P)-binding protein [Kitasatospora sp. NPDC056181]|uniref:NAD(P)-binding protein n=1 Tax=Kitasatospora sp. NPDC056181 TaxID=3345737 RepID=UPI0035D9D3D1
MSGVRRVQVLVVGAGRAGPAAGYHLRRAGLDFAILDASNAPGGARQHYGESLRRGSCSRPDADVRSVDHRAATLDQ